MLTVEENKVERPFSVKHFQLLLTWCKILKIDPRISYSKFHKDYSFYSRRQDTVKLINKGYRHAIITMPKLYANTGFEVEFFDDMNNPMKFLEKCQTDGETTLAFALRGDWNFIRFKPGASMVSFYDSVLPSFFSSNNSLIENLSFEEKGKLPVDPYPHGWFDEHWEIYNLLRKPRNEKMGDVVKMSGFSWDKVLKCFNEVYPQCKVLSSFFPLGREGYSLQLLTFKTEYEIGVLKALKKLNRTSYLYKANGVIILWLYLIPRPYDVNISTRKFCDLQEKGYIRDLHVCTPINWDFHLE